MAPYASAGKHAVVILVKPMQATSGSPRAVARICSMRCSARKVAVVCWRPVSTPWMAVAKPAPTATRPTAITNIAARSSATVKPSALRTALLDISKTVFMDGRLLAPKQGGCHGSMGTSMGGSFPQLTVFDERLGMRRSRGAHAIQVRVFSSLQPNDGDRQIGLTFRCRPAGEPADRARRHRAF